MKLIHWLARSPTLRVVLGRTGRALSSATLFNEIAELFDLFTAGVLSPDEFRRKKYDLLISDEFLACLSISGESEQIAFFNGVARLARLSALDKVEIAAIKKNCKFKSSLAEEMAAFESLANLPTSTKRDLFRNIKTALAKHDEDNSVRREQRWSRKTEPVG